MAATEKIGATELSTYGLRLARLDGNADLPPYKNIIDEHDFENNLLVLDEKTIKIRLIGFYASKPALGTAIANFHTKIRSALKQVWTFANHGFYETCVVKNGVNTMVFGNGVEITLTLTVIENLNTPSLLPVIETLQVENIVYGAVSCACDFKINLISLGTALPYGWASMCWGFAEDALNYEALLAGSELGVKTRNVDHDLPPDTDIYYQVRANNIAGYGYGEILIFHTPLL